jgi:HK97 family phage major capsid protein
MDLSLKKLTGLCYVTDELLTDAAALESVLMQGFAEEFGFKIDDAIISGNGAGQPLGILNSDALVKVAKESGQAAGTITVENIVKMWSRMWGRSRQNAVWLINQDVEPQLYTMSLAIGDGGVPVYMPANGLADKPYSTLFGRPVIPIEQCSSLGTLGDIILADFSQYLLIDKGGINAASSIHVRFLYDESVFRFIYRVDGQPVWDKALTPYKGSSSLSPFVALADRK